MEGYCVAKLDTMPSTQPFSLMNEFGWIDLWDLSRKGFGCLAGAFHALPDGCSQFCFVITKLGSSGSVLCLQLLQTWVLEKIKITAYNSSLFSSTTSSANIFRLPCCFSGSGSVGHNLTQSHTSAFSALVSKTRAISSWRFFCLLDDSLLFFSIYELLSLYLTNFTYVITLLSNILNWFFFFLGGVFVMIFVM